MHIIILQNNRFKIVKYLHNDLLRHFMINMIFNFLNYIMRNSSPKQ